MINDKLKKVGDQTTGCPKSVLTGDILYEEQLNPAKPYFTARRALYLDIQTLNHFLKAHLVFAELCQKKYFHLLQEMQFSQQILKGTIRHLEKAILFRLIVPLIQVGRKCMLEGLSLCFWVQSATKVTQSRCFEPQKNWHSSLMRFTFFQFATKHINSRGFSS